MTSVRLVPVESTTIQETMESLGLNFSLDPVVTKALLATKIQNLEEFRFLFEDESKVDTFLAKLQLGDERLIKGLGCAELGQQWPCIIRIRIRTGPRSASAIWTPCLLTRSCAMSKPTSGSGIVWGSHPRSIQLMPHSRGSAESCLDDRPCLHLDSSVASHSSYMHVTCMCSKSR